jgi:hypothetical protein
VTCPRASKCEIRDMRVLRTRISLISLIFCLLAGCAGTTSAGQSLAPTPAPIQAASATPGVGLTDPAATPAIQPGAEPSPTPSPLPRTNYTITAVLNYDTHLLVVDEHIDYTNRTPDELDELLLLVEPLHYPGAFNLKSIAWEDGASVQDFSFEGTMLHLPLPASLQPGSQLVVSLNYELSLPSPVPSSDVRPIPFGYTARQTNLVDWFPYIPPYQHGEGWLAHPAGYFGEHLAFETADFDVSFKLSGSRSDLVVAASAPALREGDGYRYRYDDARNFALSVSPEYQVYTATVGTTTVISYAFSYHAAAGQAVLQTTTEALGLYNQLFGAYPRPLLSVVEADFLDGMEYDGLYFLSNGFYNLYQGTPGEYLVAIAAHETAHQWFYARVGNDQALEPWLDEALCTYSERLYFENLHPDALQWWWDYRVNYYQPQGWVDGSIYNPAGYRAYRDAVYLNGALFLEALRKQVGDEAFFAFLRDYVAQMTGKIATSQDFFRILREHTSADLSPLLKAYFQGQ